MTARPVTGHGDTRDAAEPWPPADWFRKPDRDPAATGRTAQDRPAQGRAAARVMLRARTAQWVRGSWPWLVLWPWALAWVAFQAGMAGQSWHFFAQGGRLLFANAPGAGLQLYATHPDLQIGPLALAVSGMLRAIGPGNGESTAIAAMSLTGPLVLAAVWRLVPAAERRRRSRLLFAGLLFLPVWTELTTHFAHIDDLMALGFSVAALHAVARRHPVWAGLALAAAADSKPWAAAFVVLLLALPRRQWLTALAAFTGGIAAVWLPFLLADPRTVAAVTRFTIPNDRSSALRALGVMDSRTPWWDRSAQLLLGLAGGAVAVRRGRWPAVLLVAVAARILLDPGVYAYYTAGALLGAIVVDLVVTRWRVPWATVTAALLLYAARFTHALIPFNLHQLGELRLVFAIGVPVMVLGFPGWWVARRPGRHARGQAAAGGAGGADHVPGGGPHPAHPSGPFPAHPSGPFPVREPGTYPAHPSGPLPVRQPRVYTAHPSGPFPVRPPGGSPARLAAGTDPALKSVVWERLAHRSG
ncbi:MAG TPA: glycosyltransferase family 87 protein [Streptosporangiaceae bacterium]